MREYENVFTIKESENIQNYICDIFTKKKMQGFSYECIYTALQKIIMVGDYLSDLEETFGKGDKE